MTLLAFLKAHVQQYTRQGANGLVTVHAHEDKRGHKPTPTPQGHQTATAAPTRPLLAIKPLTGANAGNSTLQSVNRAFQTYQALANRGDVAGLQAIKPPLSASSNAYAKAKHAGWTQALQHAAALAKSSAAPVLTPAMTPQQAAAIPGGQQTVHVQASSVPLPKLSLARMAQVGPQGGSNPGGIFKDQATGTDYYVKKQRTDDHTHNEILAQELYKAAGCGGLDMHTIDIGGGRLGTAAPIVAKRALDTADPADLKHLQGTFGATAWLANWDAVLNDNTQMVAGKATVMDTGGALLFRAQGGPKGAAFGDQVTEFDSLRDPKGVNPTAAAVFGKMTPQQVAAAVAPIAAIDDATIQKLVQAHGPGDAAAKQALAGTLIKRRDDLVARAAKLGGAGAAKPAEPGDAPSGQSSKILPRGSSASPPPPPPAPATPPAPSPAPAGPLPAPPTIGTGQSAASAPFQRQVAQLWQAAQSGGASAVAAYQVRGNNTYARQVLRAQHALLAHLGWTGATPGLVGGAAVPAARQAAGASAAATAVRAAAQSIAKPPPASGPVLQASDITLQNGTFSIPASPQLEADLNAILAGGMPDGFKLGDPTSKYSTVVDEKTGYVVAPGVENFVQQRIATALGFDAAPRVLSKTQMDAACAADPGGEGYRAAGKTPDHTGKQLMDQLREGPLFLGNGMYGNGTYATRVGRGGRLKDAELDSAGYAGGIPPGAQARVHVPFKAMVAIKHGDMRAPMRAGGAGAPPSSAYTTVQRRLHDTSKHLQAVRLRLALAPSRHARTILSALQDHSVVAMLAGIDVIHVPNGGIVDYVNVLNRSKMAVQKENHRQ